MNYGVDAAVVVDRPIIIHHAGCTDGFAALWVARKALGDIEAIPGRYEERLAPPVDVAGRDVYILDFSYPPEVFAAMRGIAKSIVMLDHHDTVIEDYAGEAKGYWQDIDLDCTVILDRHRSGAGLAWDHFFEGQSRPWFIDYVEDRDLWRWKLPMSREINAYLMHLEHDFEVWDRVDHLHLSTARDLGAGSWESIQSYVRSMSSQARIARFVAAEEELIAPVVNAPSWHVDELCEALVSTPLCLWPGISFREAQRAWEAFHLNEVDDHFMTRNGVWVPRSSMVDHAPFAAAWYEKASGLVKYSVRSRDHEREDGTAEEAFDVGSFAKRFPGGGGHRKAAGFTLQKKAHDSSPMA